MKKVNKIQERYLGLITNNYKLNYEERLDLINEVFPHQRCLNSQMTQVHKCLNWLSPDIMNDILIGPKHRYNTWHYNLLWVIDPTLVDMVEIQIWSLLPREIKNSTNLDSFKLEIKQWRFLECSCTLCKTYLQNLGYV